MIDKIISFFSLDLWGMVSNVFTIFGVVSVLISIYRFIHNSRIKEWKGNVTIADYKKDDKIEYMARSVFYSKIWDESSPYAVKVLFKPNECLIKKLKVIVLDSDGNESYVVEEYKNITPETPVCFMLEYAECAPLYKLRWYIDFGEYSEYEFIQNGRNGITKIDGSVYKTNLFSIIRKAFGLI